MAEQPAFYMCYFSAQVWACLKTLYWSESQLIKSLLKIFNLNTSVCRTIIRKGIAIKYKWHSHAKHIFLWSKSFYDRTRLILSPTNTGKNKLYPLISILIWYIMLLHWKVSLAHVKFSATVDFWPPVTKPSIILNYVIHEQAFPKDKISIVQCPFLL